MSTQDHQSTDETDVLTQRLRDLAWSLEMADEVKTTDVSPGGALPTVRVFFEGPSLTTTIPEEIALEIYDRGLSIHSFAQGTLIVSPEVSR